MNQEEWSFKFSDLFTVPNLLTYLRFLLIVPFVYFFLNGNFVLSVILIVLSGLSDCLDGFFARKLNQVTSLGKILDPIADKLTLFAVVCCMIYYIPSVIPLLIVLVLKDLLLLLGGMDLIKKGLTPPPAQWYGKLGTVVFYFSVCLIIFLKAALNYENNMLDIILLLVTSVVMIFALVQYSIIYFKMVREYNLSLAEKRGEEQNNIKED